MRIFPLILKGLLPFCIALVGLLTLYFDYWSEVFCPIRSRHWLNLAPLSMGVLVAAGVLAVVIAAVIWFGKSAPKLRIIALLDIGLCVALLVAVPLRFEFFFIGAKSRVALCGGAQSIREAALTNLAKSNDSGKQEYPWPIRGLTDAELTNLAVIPHPAAGAVEIRIPSRRNTSDQFSYVAVQGPILTCPLEAWRTWRLADGLFFCQK